MKKLQKTVLRCSAIRAKVFGVNVYRGFANLCDLADVSRADIYDQQRNPNGTQRDLNSKHAREAYEYVKNKDFGFWPEVFLCARKKDVVTFKLVSPELPDIGILEINIVNVQDNNEIAISRVDGNHRLHYGDGAESNYPRVEKLISFCLAYDLTREEEIQLFKDINKNQKPMNTSHLDGIEVRLTPEEELKRRNPELYIAKRLNQDKNSPLCGRIYEGGKKQVGVDIQLRGLRTGIEFILSRSTVLPQLEDAEAQYRVIRSYFCALKLWQPNAWESPKEYIILRGSGLWAVCLIGAVVIDRSLNQDKIAPHEMLEILRSGKEWDWGKKGDFVNFGGQAGAIEISKKVTRKLHDDNRISTEQLFKKIMDEDSNDI